jgi:ribokinase
VAPVSLTVVGSVNLDLVARCSRLPRPGETVQATRLDRVPGGKGANQAVAAARLDAAVRMVGRVGDDAFADEALQGLLDAGVELDVPRVDTGTGVALIQVDDAGETQITVVPGANASLGPDDVAVGGHEAVLCQLEIPDATVAAVAEQATGFFALNAAPARPVAPEVLSRADLVIVNPYEYEQLDRRRPRVVALTLGADGAVLLRDGCEVAKARPPAVEVVDGTGAGDAFSACLVVSLLEGRNEAEALARACAAGALAASRFGAQPSLPTTGEIDLIV